MPNINLISILGGRVNIEENRIPLLLIALEFTTGPKRRGFTPSSDCSGVKA